MKRKKAPGRSISQAGGKLSRNQLMAKAAATEKLAETARQHWRSLKAEQKQARKAFKQAKKAAKLARKEARVGLSALQAFARKMAKGSKQRPVKRKAAFSRGRTRVAPGRKPSHGFKRSPVEPLPLASGEASMAVPNP